MGVGGQVGQEDQGHLEGPLVHRGAHAPLQHHLQDLRVGGLLLGGPGQLNRLLLHVLDGHLHGPEHHLRPLDDLDARLYVWERVGRGYDGLALELLVEVAVGSAVRRERGGVHKAP